MSISVGWLRNMRKSLFSIPLEETTFAKRGFHTGNASTQYQLEQIGLAFVQGYHASLEEDRFDVLVPSLQAVKPELRGFAFEGAAMGLSLLDYFFPFKERLVSFMQGPGAAHIYMLHVGAGWTLGRLPRSARKLMKQFDPLLRWLVLDGYGFHQGYFSWRLFLQDCIPPSRLSEEERQVFDQGLGRSLWFVKGGDVSQVTANISAFPPSRQADLWSGVGLACAYAGGVERADIEELYTSAGDYRYHLAQGATFAAKARQRAGNPTSHTDLACQIFTIGSSEEAAQISDECLKDLPPLDHSYSLWRLRIRKRIAEQANTFYEERRL